MEVRNLFYYFVEGLSWISLIVTSIGLLYFVKDIWNDYQMGKTNYRIYFKRQHLFEHPAITICFEQQTNQTTLQKYNLTQKDLIMFNEIKKPISSPLPTVIDNIVYQVGRDYYIQFSLRDHESMKDIIIDEVIHTEEVEVNDLNLLHYGKCTVIKISDKIKTSTQMHTIMTIAFKGGKIEDLPFIKVFFTSKANTFGAFWLQWMEGEVLSLDIDPKQGFHYFVNLKLQILKQLKDWSNCTDNANYYRCVANK